MPANPNPEPAANNEPMYRAIEAFIERASADEVAGLFKPIRDGLTSLKGPRAEHARKIQKAIDKAQELLSHLLEVREKLEADRQAQGTRR
jgi:hypothetical protein